MTEEVKIDEKVIARIKKMLNLANDAAASEGERDNAMRMAHATLAKYNLDMAALEASTGVEAQDEARDEYRGQFFGKEIWALRVAQSVGKLFFCFYLYSGRGKNVQHIFIGRKSNAQAAIELSAYLVESIRKESRRSAARQFGAAYGAGGPTQWKTDFRKGAAAAIYHRVIKLMEESEKQKSDIPNPGTAIVLASLYVQEAKANQVVVAQKYGGRVSGRGRNDRATRTSGATEGRAYGNSVSLERPSAGKISAKQKQLS